MKFSRTLGGVAVVLCAWCCAGRAVATSEEAEFLKHVAEQFVLAQFPDRDEGSYKVEVEAGRLDEKRDYGGKCQGYLTAELAGQKVIPGALVKIMCSKPDSRYSISVPVSVTILRPTLIASRPLPRGTVIDSSMLTETWVSEKINNPAAINDLQGLEGVKLKKDIKAGSQIKRNDFCMVCRGDMVTIEASTSNLSLKTSGQAVDDGNLNDTVQIRNSKSKKIVTAVVTGPGAVRVML